MKLENFNHELFKERTLKNHEEMKKTKVMDVHSAYLISLKNFLAMTLQYIDNHSKSFENERDTLLKESNLLQKEKNKNSYKKDKHKSKKFDDGY